MAEKKIKLMVKLQGHPLPKRIFRPFRYHHGDSGKEKLDDKQYIQVSNADKRLLIFIIAALFYVFTALFLFGWIISDFGKYGTFDSYKYMINTFIGGSVFITLGLLSKPNKFLIFDREKGMVHHPQGMFSFGTVSGKWEDWGARISLGASSDGPSLHRLSLMYFPTNDLWQIEESSMGVDYILGVWSFLVQYMEPDGVLPDIPEFKDFQNTVKGFGIREEWLELKKKPGFIDPYYQWLAELNENPELDVVNAEIEERRRPKWSD